MRWRRRGAARNDRVPAGREGAGPPLALRQQTFDRFSAAVELPMLVLTIVMIPVLILPYVIHHPSAKTQSLLDAADYFIWAVFLFEYLVRLTLAPRRWHFVTHNWADLVIVAVPMLRPLRLIRSIRVLRALRLSRLSALVGEGTQKAKRSLHARATGYVIVITTALILVTSVVVLDLERDVKGANIKSFGDALWWAVSTVFTVGYGDRYPVSAGGRAVATVLMMCGIGLIGVIAAAVAAYFVGEGSAARQTVEDAEVLRRLEAIERLLRVDGVDPGLDDTDGEDREFAAVAKVAASSLRQLLAAVPVEARPAPSVLASWERTARSLEAAAVGAPGVIDGNL